MIMGQIMMKVNNIQNLIIGTIMEKSTNRLADVFM